MKNSRTKTFLLLLAALIFYISQYDIKQSAATPAMRMNIEGGPEVYVLDTASDTRSQVRGVHFNINKDVASWNIDRASQILGDMAAKGNSRVLFYINANDVYSPKLQAMITLATGYQMQVIIRIHNLYYSHLSGGGWDDTANAIVFLNRQYGIKMFQVLNEADAYQDWAGMGATGALCVNPAERDALPFLTESAACNASGNFIFTPNSYWDWGTLRTYDGYEALGRYVAEEYLNLLVTIGTIYQDNPSTNLNFKVVVPPIATPDITAQSQYYLGFMRYYMDNRLSWWDMSRGGSGDDDEVPPLLNPVISLHVYSAESLAGICTGDGNSIVNNVMDVLNKSFELRASIQAGIAGMTDTRGRNIGYDFREFIMTETGPSPDMLMDACGGTLSQDETITIRNAMRSWNLTYSLICKDLPVTLSDIDSNCIPYTFWVGTWHSLASDVPIPAEQCPPGTICQTEWEITALYPSQLCNDNMIECFSE